MPYRRPPLFAPLLSSYKILKENSVLYQDDNDWKHVLEIKNIRTKGIDKDTGKNSCEAELTVETTYLNDKYGATGKKINKNATITYTSEKTSEGKHYVSVSIPQ